jgi:protoheme IX farnesyltransferase
MSDYYSLTKNSTACSQPEEITIWRNYLALTKPKIYISISITALMGLALQSNFTHYSGWVILSLAVATMLASAGGAVLNHYFERETDGLMERTKDRPLVKGVIHPPRYALYFGWLLALSGGTLCYLSLGGWALFWLFMGFFTYVFAYTLWLKHTSYWNITIGGLCSSFAVLAGDTAVSGILSTNGLILALLMFFWNPAHFLNLAVLYQTDYARAGIPMLPHLIGNRKTQGFILINVLLLVGCSLGLGIVGTPGIVYLSVASLFGFLLTVANIQNYILVSTKLFRRNFIFANMYLMILFIGISIDFFF